MISPHKIIYNKLSNIDFDVLVDVAFDSDNGETSAFLSRDAVASEHYRGEFKRVHYYKYNEVFSPTFTFVKNDFSEFTQQEQRKILTWLTSKSTASFLTVYYDDSDVISWDALGGWIDIQPYKIANKRTVGFVATFEAVTPWALSPRKTITQDVSDTEHAIIEIDIQTDEPQSPVYPRITIQQDNITSVVNIDHRMTDADVWVENTVYYCDSYKEYYWVDDKGKHNTAEENTSGIELTSVQIENIYTDHDGKIHTFDSLVKNNIKGENVVLDGANRIVSSSRLNGRVFGDDFDFNWIPLYDGKNELRIVGNCTVTIEYREPIKIGQY